MQSSGSKGVLALLPNLLQEVRRIAIEAGDNIMMVYEGDFEVETKEDNSPVTTADLAAHEHITDELRKLIPSFPILSEESALVPFSERSERETYWLVDPLDGTKEFINKNHSFAVNIALIHQHKPILGVVYAPALGVNYFASEGQGSFKQQGNPLGDAFQINARELPESQAVFVGSRTHTGEAMITFLEKFTDDKGKYELLNMGSSLKMCMVAEGKADLYPRLWLTSEWDTAAAHCILNEAGGSLVKTDMSPLLYNTKDSLLNPFFFAIGNNQVQWNHYLPIELV